MSELITIQNLDQVIEINKNIKNEIAQCKASFFMSFNSSGVTSNDKLAIKVLKDHHLIQIPIDDEYWGGAIIIDESFKIPIINTAQPRAYQNFVAWHEIYHLFFDQTVDNKSHDIKIELEMNERKADYFAALMILGNVYEYYYSLENKRFLERIFHCMDMFKVPYKAVLIHLYEEAVEKYHDEKLKGAIIHNFETPRDLEDSFEKLGLDTELVKPSYVLNLGGLEEMILENVNNDPDVSYHKANYLFLETIKAKILQAKEGLIKCK